MPVLRVGTMVPSLQQQISHFKSTPVNSRTPERPRGPRWFVVLPQYRNSGHVNETNSEGFGQAVDLREEEDLSTLNIFYLKEDQNTFHATKFAYFLYLDTDDSCQITGNHLMETCSIPWDHSREPVHQAIVSRTTPFLEPCSTPGGHTGEKRWCQRSAVILLVGNLTARSHSPRGGPCTIAA